MLSSNPRGPLFKRVWLPKWSPSKSMNWNQNAFPGPSSASAQQRAYGYTSTTMRDRRPPGGTAGRSDQRSIQAAAQPPPPGARQLEPHSAEENRRLERHNASAQNAGRSGSPSVPSRRLNRVAKPQAETDPERSTRA
jgi:hypothetical protein